MDIEHESTPEQEHEPMVDQPISTPTELDPSIDPNVLLDENGRIAAVETSEPEVRLDGAFVPPMIEGLPVIGAQAGVEARDEIEHYAELTDDVRDTISEKMNKQRDSLERGATVKDLHDLYYDTAENDAMAAEVRTRAENVIKAMTIKETGRPPGDEKVKQYADLFEEAFRTELEKRNQESIKAANDVADRLTAEAKAKLEEGKTVSEALPETEGTSESTSTENPADLFKSMPETATTDPHHEENAGDLINQAEPVEEA